MRLQPIPPDDLTEAQKPLAMRMREGIGAHLSGFESYRQDGALIGPYNPMLRFPVFGTPAWDLFTALAEHSKLPKDAHEVAILMTGARHTARYEIYAHEAVAARSGLSPEQVSCLAAGIRPDGLTASAAVAFNVVSVLTRGAQLPQSTYLSSLAAFGEEGTAELVYLIGCYSLVSVLLNAYDVPVPGRD